MQRNPLFNTPIRATILCADQPLSMGGVPYSMPMAEFLQKHHMEGWTNSLLIKSDLLEPITPEEQQEIDEDLAPVFAGIQKNQESLVIHPMGGDTGFGVSTTQLIRAGDPIDFYAGVFHLEASNNPDIDCKSPYNANVVNEEGTTIGMTDAKAWGNTTRFIAHAPRNLDNVDVKKPYRICTENVARGTFIDVGTFRIELLRAAKDIPANSALFFDYNSSYWEALNVTPVLYRTNGTIVPASEYKYKEIFFNVKIGTTTIKGSFDLAILNRNFAQKKCAYLTLDGIQIYLSEADFYKYYTNPACPFITVAEPTCVEILDATKIQPGLLTQASLFKQVSKLGELKRISANLMTPNDMWKFDKKNKTTAFLLSTKENAQNITTLFSYLQSHQLQVSLHKTTEQLPLLQITNMDTHHLLSISPYNVSLQAPKKRK